MKAINAYFDYDSDEITTRVCFPEKVIELSSEQFRQFKSRPQDDYWYLTENEESMYESEKGIYHGLLLMNKANADGIFVMNTIFKREYAYIPYARYYLEKEQNPSLDEFTRKALKKVDECVTKAVQDQESGKYQILLSEVDGVRDNIPFDSDLFIEMLNDREEIERAELDYEDLDDTIHFTISKEYLREENDDGLKVLTQKEVNIMCAKHLLWLRDVIGEQADFSGCLLRGIKLNDRELENANFDGAKLVDVDMNGTDLSYSSFVGTRIANASIYNCTATEADFTKAEISNSQISQCDMSSSNFKKAVLRNCNVYRLNMRDSCIEKINFSGTKKDYIDTTDCAGTEREWIALREGTNIEMGE